MRPFAEALNALEPELLERLDVSSSAGRRRAWPIERVEKLLAESTRAALRGLTFETDSRPARGDRAPAAPRHARRNPVVRRELAEHDLRVPRERIPFHRKQRLRAFASSLHPKTTTAC